MRKQPIAIMACWRGIAIALAGIALAGCSHIPLVGKKAETGTVVGVVEYDTGLTKFSTVTGIYHQDMCSKDSGDTPVHLRDREMRKLLAMATANKFYDVPADLGTVFPDPPGRPPHCANFRLHIEAGERHNEVRWDCGADGSNTPPPAVAPLVLTIQQMLRARKEVRELPWSRCPVR